MKIEKAKHVEKYTWYDISDELWRSYKWDDKRELLIADPVRFMLSGSGRHYIEAKDGRNYIIAQGWTYLTFFSKMGFTMGTPQEAKT